MSLGKKSVFRLSDLFGQNGGHIGVPNGQSTPCFVIFRIFFPQTIITTTLKFVQFIYFYLLCHLLEVRSYYFGEKYIFIGVACEWARAMQKREGGRSINHSYGRCSLQAFHVTWLRRKWSEGETIMQSARLSPFGFPRYAYIFTR